MTGSCGRRACRRPGVLIQVKPELLIEPGQAVRRNLQALLLLAQQPAQINEPREQGTAQGARKVQASLRGVRVVPHRSPAGRDGHPERLQERPALDSYRVPDLASVKLSSLVDGLEVAPLDNDTHHLYAEPAGDMVVADTSLPMGPGSLALLKRPDRQRRR
jgi:hypothetical protein